MTGSHLDSVLDGGAYDGPLGVVSALAAVDLLRERGFRPARPIGVSVFVEEEGSRFGLACLGSRLATGATDWSHARALRDRDGVPARRGDGRRGPGRRGSPALVGTLTRSRCFVELHVEQGRDLVDRGHAVGVASRIWPHGRYRFDISGEPNHAGTTRMEDRHDPMLTYAMTALAANKQARLAGQRATFGRVETTPNSTNSVPSAVTAWMDARCEIDEALADARRHDHAAGRGAGAARRDVAHGHRRSRSPVPSTSTSASRPDRGDHEGGDWPVIATQAGHDAGVLSAQGIPSAMLFVRNPTGVSHSPAEHAEIADCLAGVDALAETLERLAR